MIIDTVLTFAPSPLQQSVNLNPSSLRQIAYAKNLHSLMICGPWEHPALSTS